jgi:cellulose synthase/poly-beta-1,6-N-acetylglucosamine synthase-like glycosyltransferase
MTWYIFVELIIFSCISNLANVFVFYPIILWILSKVANKPLILNKDYRPEITVVIAAYNEEKNIKDAILSIFDSGYPLELTRVLVGSDGSTDNSLSILKEMQADFPNIEYYDFPRSGKNGVLNSLVPFVKTDIVFFQDADVRIKYGAIGSMIEVLSDSNVGAVLSNIKYISTDSDENKNAGRTGENLYMLYEKSIRIYESKIASTVNSAGPFYAVRKEYFQSIPNDLLCDDLYRILYVAKNFKRVIFSEEAVVHEVREKEIGSEISRRIRFVAGGWATIWNLKVLLLPRYSWVSFFVTTHKVTRWLAPIFYIGILLGSLILPWDFSAKKPLLIIQVILYGSAILGYIFEKFKIKFFLFQVGVFIVSMNIGFLFGLFRFLARSQNSKWERIDTVVQKS